MRINLTLKDRPEDWELFSLEMTEENVFFKNAKGSYRKETCNLFCVSVEDRLINNCSKEDSDWVRGMRGGLNGSGSEELQ